MAIATFWTFAALLLAGCKIAVATGVADYVEALADLTKNSANLKAALKESGHANLAREMERIAKDARSFTHPGPARDDAEAIFWQVAPVALTDRSALAAANLDPRTACDMMIATIIASDPHGEFAIRPICEQYFRAVVEPLLATMIADKAYMTDLSPDLWRETLRRHGIQIKLLERIDLTTQRTETKVDDMTAMLRQLLEQSGEADKARQSNITDAHIVALARQVAEDIDDPEQAFCELEAAVTDAVEYRASLAIGSNADRLVTDLRNRLDDLANAGRLEDAQAEANRTIAAFEADEEARRERATETLGQLLETGLRQDLAVRDADAAAGKIALRIEIESPDPEDCFLALRSEIDTWLESSERKERTLDGEVADALTSKWIGYAVSDDQIGEVHGRKAAILLSLGRRQRNTKQLEEVEWVSDLAQNFF